MTVEGNRVAAAVVADEQSQDRCAWSFRRTVLFWWGLYLVIQQAGRLFLLPEALSIETPSAGMLAKTLVTGLRADLIVATLGVVLGMTAAFALWLPHAALSKLRGMPVNARVCGRGFAGSSLLIAVLLMALVTVDMGYYGYNHAHLDFVFLEYVDDLFAKDDEQAKAPGDGTPTSQAFQQTEAELKEAKKWGWRLFGFIILQGAAIIVWWQAFRRIVEPSWARWESTSPRIATFMLVLGLALGVTGFHPDGPWSIARVGINSSVYYILAQNPLWYTGDVLFSSIAYQRSGRPSTVHNTMPFEDALRIARSALAPGGTFPFLRYPFVRKSEPGEGVQLQRLPNVLLIFVEGLDRRYLDQTIAVKGGVVQGIRVTPFLDRLRDESLFFEHFFSNGAQTHHGLFASFCSYYARYGRAAIKALYTYDYLCLPTLLREAGYQTEMVIGHNRDHHQDHTALFMARNGLQQFFDESDFPARAERLGLGMTDGALFDFLRVRVGDLRASGRPFFLATLTLSTHHPFTVPQMHPDVRALQAAPDRYLAALRYLDLELERFFVGLQRDSLLKNTVVLILGDHGRHERIGRTQTEWSGHFTIPLFLWMDDSLRTPQTYQPRTVSAVASQVDLAPTILGLTGLMPRVSPFLGRDLSCLLIRDCLQDNVAFLSSVYDDLIGLADRDGVLLYSLRTETLYQTDLKLKNPPVSRASDDPAVAARYRRLLALYVSANVLLEQNRIWSWKELGAKL